MTKKNSQTQAHSQQAQAQPAPFPVFTKRILAICGIFYLVSQILFLIHIQFPRGHNFDEFHYVPSAKQFLELRENQNWEHPPLGKEIMAVGVGVFGDEPFGWRVMSTFFGSLTLVGMFLWGLAVFRDENIAIWVGIVTLFNQLLYVQSRIGMLDTFMWAFLVWGLAAFCAVWTTRISAETTRRYLGFAGAMFGLATACKWIAVVPWVFCIGLILMVRLFQYWGLGFSKPSAWTTEEEFYSPGLFDDLGYRQLALRLGAIPVLFYFLTFIPYFFIDRTPSYGLLDILQMQPKMWDGQLRVVTSHPYMSNWTSWPLMTRPIWYAFDKEPGAPEFVRGVLLLGNPLMMWGGLLAVAACVWGFLARRARDAFLISAFYLLFVFCWAVIPRKIAFYYYYYPAGMTLSLALAWVFQHLEMSLFRTRLARWAFAGAAFGMFVYFFPILSGMKIRSEDFRSWMWLQSWI